MKQQDPFSGFHPVVNFIYYAVILVFSMCFLHPVCLLISVLGAFCYGGALLGRKVIRFFVSVLLPVLLMAAILNPAFSHAGATILCYLPSGNPLTAESIYYGWAAGGMLAAVMLWFFSFHSVMTSDKFIYLFGRILPASSLLLSMILRFIPKFRRQMQHVTEAQACCGRSVKSGRLKERIRSAAAIFSIMVTWSLENAAQTADSMKSRGYGLPGRTAYSIYRMERRDWYLLAWILLSAGYIIFAWIRGWMSFRYYPTVKAADATVFGIAAFVLYALLSATPFILHRKGVRLWRSYPSET